MKPLPLKNYALMPKTYWYQEPDKIVMRIMLADVEKYYLDIDLDHIQFSTISNDKPYYLCMYFFGAVVPEKTIVENLSREIVIQIPKAFRFADWPRLQISIDRPVQVFRDPEKIQDNPWANTVRKYAESKAEYKKMMGIEDLAHDAESYCSDSDDDRFDMLEDDY